MLFSFASTLTSLLVVLEVVNSANILIVHPIILKSHLAYLEPLAEGLAEKNHSVTVISGDVHDGFDENKMEVIRTRGVDYTQLSWEGTNENFLSDVIKASQFTQTNLREFFRSRQMKELFASNRTFDAVISNTFLFFQSLAIVPYHFDALAIEFMPQSSHPYMAVYTGTRLDTSNGFDSKKTFIENFVQRAKTTLQITAVLLYNRYVVLPQQEEIVRETYGPISTSLRQLLCEKSLILANGHPSLSTPTYVPFLQRDVAGISIRSKYSVPKEYEIFINKSINGFILVSWGSMMSSWDGQIGETILESLSQIPYQVIWKASRTNFSRDIPANVMISKWIPQSSLMGHPRIKLFWTHGGYASMVETVHNAIPVVVTPSSLDQPKNAAHMASRGMGLVLNYDNITVQSVTRTINEVINMPRYKQAALNISRDFKCRLIPPKDEAIFWIEHAISFKTRLPMRLNYALHIFILDNFDVFFLFIICTSLTLLNLWCLLTFSIRTISWNLRRFRKLKAL